MANRVKEGYVLLNRNILDWRWAKTPKTAYLFINMILHANYKEMQFEGKKIHRGQFVTSLPSLAKSTGLTLQEVRTGILHLKSTGEITDESCNRYRIITIINYDEYQEATGKIAGTSTGKQQASNRQITAREKKGIKGIKEKNIPPKSPKGDNLPSEEQKDIRIDPYSGKSYVRGTDAFRNRSHVLLNQDEGTVDDIPMSYRDMFDTFKDYWRSRNR